MITPQSSETKQAYNARVGYTASQIVVAFQVVRGAAQNTANDIWDAIGNEARESGLSPRQQRLASTRLARLHDIVRPILVRTDNYIAAVSKGEYRIAFTEHFFEAQGLGYRGSVGAAGNAQLLKRFEMYPSVFMDSAAMRMSREQAIQALDRTILNALNQGKNLQQVARDIDITLGFRLADGTLTAKGQDMLNRGQRVTPKGQIYKSIRIARTEMSRMNGWANVDAMLRLQSKGFDERLQLIATLDNRTRPQSAEMHLQVSNEIGQFRYPDGNYYYKGEAPPQWSINDRETTVPYIDPEALMKYGRRTLNLQTGEFELSDIAVAEFRTWEQFARANNLTVNKYHQLMPEFKI